MVSKSTDTLQLFEYGVLYIERGYVLYWAKDL